jgi:DNA-binding SARP family transcriptional activator
MRVLPSDRPRRFAAGGRARADIVAAVTVRIRLLGRPRIEVDGQPRTLAGQKPWALLASMLLDHETTRRGLAERIWPAADDPLAATRWAILQVRRALEPAVIQDRDGRLTVAPPSDGLDVDTTRLFAGEFEVTEALELAGGELLAGMHFDDAPDLEQWLALERARTASAASSSVRWAASLLIRSEPEVALRLLERALAINPYDDPAHELVVDVHSSQGNRGAALAHIELADRRYQADLGIRVPPTIRRPLDRTYPAERMRASRRATANAHLLRARARLEAGDYDAAIEAGRRATADAEAAGDQAIEAQALTTLAGILIHTVRGHDHEAVGLLDRALPLAVGLGDERLAAEIERELGWVSFLAADYGAAESTLARSIARSERIGEATGMGRAMMILGAARSDLGEFEDAEQLLRAALQHLAEQGDRWEAFALAFLARVLVRTGRPQAGLGVGERAVTRSREVGWLSLLPWPMAVAGEAALACGESRRAQRTFDEAYALAGEIGDPCWNAFALRGLGLVAREDGDHDRALQLLGAAAGEAASLPDVYSWCEAVVLTDLTELERASDRGHLDAALALAMRGPMPDLLERLRRFAPQTGSQTPGS